MRKDIFFGLLPVMITFICAPSFAEFTFIPSIIAKEEYNDNIFLTETGRTDDFITTINPNIVLKYSPYKTINFDLDYGLEFTFYSENSNLNDTDLNETQRLNFQTVIKPSSRVYIYISDTYERVPVDIRNPTSPGNLFFNLTDSNIFTVSPNIKFPLMAASLIHIGYRYTNIWYDVDEGNDSDDHHAFVSLTKKFPNQLSVSLNYNYFAHRPDITSNYESHEGSVSANYQLMANLVVKGEAGYGFVHFDDNSETESEVWAASADYYVNALGLLVGGGYSNSYSECSVAAAKEKILTSEEGFLPSDNCNQASFESLGKNSVTTGISKTEQYNLHIKGGNEIVIIVTAYYSIDNFVESDREDEITGVAIDLSRTVSKRIDVSLNGLWEKQDFSGESDDRKVHRYSAGSSIIYNMGRNISTDVGYRYDTRNSDQENDEYDNNIVWLQAKLTF